MKFSIRSLIVLSLVIFLIVIANYERNRANRLALQISQLEQPLLEAIQKQEWLVQKKELALSYSKETIRAQLENKQKDINTLLFNEAKGFEVGSGVIPMGFRRELANIRNAQLKLSREKAKLDALKNELNAHRAKLGK